MPHEKRPHEAGVEALTLHLRDLSGIGTNLEKRWNVGRGDRS